MGFRAIGACRSVGGARRRTALRSARPVRRLRSRPVTSGRVRPDRQVSESGHRFYSPSLGRGLGRPHELQFDGSESASESILMFADDAALKGRVTIMALRVAGTWKCFEDDGESQRDNGTPIPKDSRSKVNPSECRGFDECTKKHEDDHERYLGACCEKAQDAWRNARSPYDKRVVKGKWRGWYRRHSRRTECEAYKVSARCYADYYEKYGCCEEYKKDSDPKGEAHWRSCCDQSVANTAFDENEAKGHCDAADVLDRRLGRAPPCPSF
jgi:hypothetical protein